MAVFFNYAFACGDAMISCFELDEHLLEKDLRSHKEPFGFYSVKEKVVVSSSLV